MLLSRSHLPLTSHDRVDDHENEDPGGEQMAVTRGSDAPADDSATNIR